MICPYSADVDAAYTRLEARGLIADGTLTPDGAEAREEVERATDRAARAPVENLGDRAEELFELLTPMARAIVAQGLNVRQVEATAAAIRSTPAPSPGADRRRRHRGIQRVGSRDRGPKLCGWQAFSGVNARSCSGR